HRRGRRRRRRGRAVVGTDHGLQKNLADRNEPPVNRGLSPFDFVREKAGIREFRLRSNGLQTLLLSNDVAPVATFAVVYRVGSRNEAVGHTGATHLLEHLMFKGTPEFDREKGTAIAAVLEALGARFN